MQRVEASPTAFEMSFADDEDEFAFHDDTMGSGETAVEGSGPDATPTRARAPASAGALTTSKQAKTGTLSKSASKLAKPGASGSSTAGSGRKEGKTLVKRKVDSITPRSMAFEDGDGDEGLDDGYAASGVGASGSRLIKRTKLKAASTEIEKPLLSHCEYLPTCSCLRSTRLM